MTDAVNLLENILLDLRDTARAPETRIIEARIAIGEALALLRNPRPAPTLALTEQAP